VLYFSQNSAITDSSFASLNASNILQLCKFEMDIYFCQLQRTIKILIDRDIKKRHVCISQYQLCFNGKTWK